MENEKKDIKNAKKGELSTKTIAQLSKEYGISAAAVRSQLQIMGVDRRGDLQIERYNRILKLKKKGLTTKEIRKDKKLCELFFRPDGQDVPYSSIRKYLSDDFVLEEHVDFSKSSTYSKYQRGKASDCIQSLGYSQDEILKNILDMYVQDDHYDCDLTYSKGNFYKKINKPLWRFDKYPQADEEGVLPLPLDDVNKHVEAGCLNSIVIDLPFLVGGSDTSIVCNRFTYFPSYNEMIAANENVISIASRILKDDGILVMKTQDSNSSGEQVWTHGIVEEIAKKNHFVIEDLFIAINADKNGDPRFLTIRKLYTQVHARKVHTYFYVFRKKTGEILAQQEQQYNKALRELDQHHTEEAINILTPIAKNGCRDAMLTLGDIYYWGRGVDVDTYEAIHWCKMAADKGSDVALFNLGQIYYNMGSNMENNRLAFNYFCKATTLRGKWGIYIGLMVYNNRARLIPDEDWFQNNLAILFALRCGGDAIADLYLYLLCRKRKSFKEFSEKCYTDGESLLKTPSDYHEWARVLCNEKEYEKALPYIEKCLCMSDCSVEDPSFFDTYGEILYGLDRLDLSEQAFNRCLEIATKMDERRRIYEIEEKIRRKFPQS